jgi:hypothetical protein
VPLFLEEEPMNYIKSICVLLSLAMLAGCASTSSVSGAKGPELVSSGRSTESGHYAEVGVQFTTMGDFVAVFSPTRWKNPVETGGSLSWLNPGAWSDDAGRTGRILLGEAVVVGGVAIAAASAGGSSGGESDAGGATPPPPGPPPPGP